MLASAAGRPAVVGAISAPAALSEEVLKSMWFHKLKMIAGTLMAGTLLAAGVVAAGAGRGLPEPTVEGRVAPETDRGIPDVGVDADPATEEAAPAVLRYGDGQADGKQSLGGSGEMIEFSASKVPAQVAALRIHGSRYGLPEPPDESFLIYFLTEDRKLHPPH